MREHDIDRLVRRFATSWDRRSLLGMVVGAIAATSLWPSTTRAESRDTCREKQERCRDKRIHLCQVDLAFRWYDTRLNVCLNRSKKCCEAIQWDDRANDQGGACVGDQGFDSCLERLRSSFFR